MMKSSSRSTTAAVLAFYFLRLGTFQVSSEEWPKCDSGFLGGSYSLSHSKYCDRYYTCDKGNITLHTCLYGLAYHSFLGCRPWHSVGCTFNYHSYYEELYPEIKPPSQIFVTQNPDGSVNYPPLFNPTLETPTLQANETHSQNDFSSADHQANKPLDSGPSPAVLLPQRYSLTADGLYQSYTNSPQQNDLHKTDWFHSDEVKLTRPQDDVESNLPPFRHSQQYPPRPQQPNQLAFGHDATLDIVLISLTFFTAPSTDSNHLPHSIYLKKQQSSVSSGLKNPSTTPTEPSITVTSRPLCVRDPPSDNLLTVNGVVYPNSNTFLNKLFFTLHIKKPVDTSVGPSTESDPENRFDFEVELTDSSPDTETSETFTEASTSSDLAGQSDQSDLHSIHPILRQFVLGARIFPTPESLKVADYDCPTPNGVFADPKGCGRFFKCENGVAYSDRCFPGLVFQESTKLCKQGSRKEVKVCQQT